MESSPLLQQIRTHYPQDLEYTYHIDPISPTVYSMLSKEIQESGYASFEDSYLSSFLANCKSHHTLKTSQCTIHIVSPQKDMPPKLLLIRVTRRVQCILNAFGIQKHLTFWLLPSPHLRKFPRKSTTPVSPEHINGGFTYSQLNTIFVFRREEFPKVFLHETLHHTPIDMHSSWKESDLSKLYRYFDFDTKGCNRTQCETDMRPNEAWVEVWAELYHLSFLQFEYRFPWKAMWNAEREWACMQAKRVLLHQQHQPDGKWREKTHAFSYMVMRAALLWCTSKLLATSSTMNSEDLTRLIISCFETPSFQQYMAHLKLPTHACFRMTIHGDL